MDGAGGAPLPQAPGAGPGPHHQQHRPVYFQSCDPAEWQTWKINFRQLVWLNNWNHRHARLICATSLIGKAKESVQHINIQVNGDADANAPDFEGLLTEYDAVFLPAAHGDIARAALHNITQNPSEDINSWHNRCRHAYILAFPNVADLNANIALVDLFIKGLHSPYIKERTHSTRPQTYVEALAAAQNAEATALICQKDASTNKGVFHVVQHSSNGKSANDVKCYLCDASHYLRDCPQMTKARALLNRQNSRQPRRGDSNGFRRRGNNRGWSVNAITPSNPHKWVNPSLDSQAGGSTNHEQVPDLEPLFYQGNGSGREPRH